MWINWPRGFAVAAISFCRENEDGREGYAFAQGCGGQGCNRPHPGEQAPKAPADADLPEAVRPGREAGLSRMVCGDREPRLVGAAGGVQLQDGAAAPDER